MSYFSPRPLVPQVRGRHLLSISSLRHLPYQIVNPCLDHEYQLELEQLIYKPLQIVNGTSIMKDIQDARFQYHVKNMEKLGEAFGRIFDEVVVGQQTMMKKLIPVEEELVVV
jgi:hypothetical protein